MMMIRCSYDSYDMIFDVREEKPGAMCVHVCDIIMLAKRGY